MSGDVTSTPDLPILLLRALPGIYSRVDGMRAEVWYVLSKFESSGRRWNVNRHQQSAPQRFVRAKFAIAVSYQGSYLLPRRNW